jgi:hypothetical protein
VNGHLAQSSKIYRSTNFKLEDAVSGLKNPIGVTLRHLDSRWPLYPQFYRQNAFGYMSTLERGASYPGPEIIGKLAAVLEVEPAELLRLPTRRGSRRK